MGFTIEQTVICDECNSVIGVYKKGESYTVDAIEHCRTEHPLLPPVRPIEDIRADIEEFLRSNP